MALLDAHVVEWLWVERMGFIFNHFGDQGFTFFSRYHSGIFNLITITCHFLHSLGKFAYFFFLLFITQVKPTWYSINQNTIVTLLLQECARLFFMAVVYGIVSFVTYISMTQRGQRGLMFYDFIVAVVWPVMFVSNNLWQCLLCCTEI